MYQEHYEEVIKNYQAQKIQNYQADFEIQMNNYRKKAENLSSFYNGTIVIVNSCSILTQRFFFAIN
jgi:hypothetical protein